ncbi:hypothetical protein KIPB_009672 [Kipferlia bialata]|uniref:Dynein regulatory complex protein 9 n=1 Tax=Kipferlia bialata TaxID=797122 RepID=A0A9K3D2Q0_9EUKA|nr:hypothetical protein KIPB_009672 [Kipferlia bialata]|eukprot:g9672.t1
MKDLDPSVGDSLSTDNIIVVSAVLDDIVEKLRFLSDIAPDVLAHREELARYVGGEISTVIERQQGLERRFEELIGQRTEFHRAKAKASLRAVQEELDVVANDLKHTTQRLCDNLRENPNVAENLNKVHRYRGEMERLLSGTLSDLAMTQTFTALRQVVERQKESQEKYAQLLEREELYQVQQEQIKTKIGKVQKDQQEETTRRQASILELRTELGSVRRRVRADLAYLKENTEGSLNYSQRQHAETLARAQDQMQHMTDTLNEEERLFTVKQEALERGLKELQRESGRWLDQTETTKTELDTEIALLEVNRDTALERIQSLKEQVALNAQEKAAYEERQAFLTRMKSCQKVVRALRADRAVANIQDIWRSALDPPPPKKEAKKGGKGGKGKKGKKGKKK